MPQLSTRGAKFIGHYEGWRPEAYNDPTNNATIGYGHLIHHGPLTDHEKAEWGTITEEHGIQLLQHDARIAETAIDHFITRPLSQAEHDALTSFAYNCGGNALSGSVGHAVNASQDPTAALAQWVHSGNQVLEGLKVRRKAEAVLFTAGDYGDGLPPLGPGQAEPAPAPDPTVVPNPVPEWAWHWVEWKLGRAQFKDHPGDPSLRHLTGAPATIPPWGWTFLQRFH
jgi:GH24 family phage-related lysozyme (muramidase)